MTPEEYVEKKNRLEAEYKRKYALLNEEYAMANNPVKLGDIIHDHYQIIKVDDIRVVNSYLALPKCIYHGPRLTKKLVEFKIREWSNVYQENVKKINGVEVSK